MSYKLFLGGVSPNTDTEAVRDHFSKYGTVTDAVVMYKDGKHRGFGFVTFETEDCMRDALSEDQIIDGRTIDVKEAVPQAEGGDFRGGAPMRSNGAPGGRPSIRAPAHIATPCDKVFLGGLAQTTTEDQVREYFQRYGYIIDCVVMKDRDTGRSRGFGFVQYDSTDPVEQIMRDYADHQVDGKWVEVKKAIPQDKLGGSPGGSRSSSRGPSGKGAAAALPSPYGAYGKGAPPAYGAWYPPPAGYPPAHSYPYSSYYYPPHYGSYPAYGGKGGSAAYGSAPPSRSTPGPSSRSKPY